MNYYEELLTLKGKEYADNILEIVVCLCQVRGRMNDPQDTESRNIKKVLSGRTSEVGWDAFHLLEEISCETFADENSEQIAVAINNEIIKTLLRK